MDLVKAVMTICAVGMFFSIYFAYKTIKATCEYYKTKLKYKKVGTCIVKELKDSRVEYGNSGNIIGRVYYYNVFLEDEPDKVLLYTEKITGNKKSMLKQGDSIKAWINFEYSYTVDYNEKTQDIRTNLKGFVVLGLLTVVSFVVSFALPDLLLKLF